MTAREKEKIQELTDEVSDMKATVGRVLFYLENDDTTNQKGFISKLQEVSEKLDGLLEREKIYKAKATVWGMVGGAIIAGGSYVLKVLITKFV